MCGVWLFNVYLKVLKFRLYLLPGGMFVDSEQLIHHKSKQINIKIWVILMNLNFSNFFYYEILFFFFFFV